MGVENNLQEKKRREREIFFGARRKGYRVINQRACASPAAANIFVKLRKIIRIAIYSDT